MTLQAKKGTKPKVAIYARVSTVEQAELGHSLSIQSGKLDELASQNDWQVLMLFTDEGKSARTIDRPSFEALLDYCEENKDILDAVLVQDTSRLCRNVKDHLEIKAFLKKRDIKLISLEGNNDDTDEAQFLDLIIAGVNELESKRTGRKTKRVMLAMFEQGLKPGQAPIGFLNSFKKGVPMYPDLERKHFIREVFDSWNTGNHSIKDISETLYEKGFRSVGGKKIGKSGIQAVLKRIEYAGGLSYEGRVNENAQHEAIITMAEFQKAQKMFEIRNKGADRSRKYTTLLAGIAYCFKCGSLMYGEYHQKGDYYSCRVCRKPYARMGYIDDAISGFFKGSAFTEKGLGRLKTALMEVKAEQESKGLPEQKRSLENRKKALDAKMSKLEDKLIFWDDSSVDKERLERKYAPLKVELKQIDGQLKELDRPSNNLKKSEIDKIIWGMGRLGEIYEALDKPQRKQFLKFFIKKVYIDCSENKIVDFELVPELEALLSQDSVRISSNWLPRVDSNHQPRS